MSDLKILHLYIVISIDTECDKGKGWRIKKPLSFIGVYRGIGEYLQPLFERLKLKPTYLLSPEVILDERSVKIFKDIIGYCEIGTHLHGEFLEPNPNPDAEITSERQSDYEPEVEFEKLKNLTQLFKNTFGFQPLSFRAGRFSISKRTFYFLENLGYKIDSSYTPFCFEHENVPIYPHFPFNSILEVPITILPKNFKLFKALKSLPIYAWRRYRRLVNGIGPIWLRPSYSNWKDMVWLVKRYKEMFGERTVLNMFFHNVDLVDDLSPYNAENGRRNLEESLLRILEMGFKPLTLSQIYETYEHTLKPS